MNSWTIGRRLTASFLAMLALTMVLSFSALNTIGRLGGLLDLSTTQTSKKIGTLNELRPAISEMRRYQFLYTYAKDATGAEASKQGFSRTAVEVEAAIALVRPLLVTEADREQIGLIETGLSSSRSYFQEIVAACSAGKPDEGFSLVVSKAVPLTDEMQKHAEALIHSHNVLVAEAASKAMEAVSTARWMALGLLFLSLGTGTGVIFVIRRITQDLRRITVAMSEGAGQVAAAAGQVSASGQALAQGSSEMATTIVETSASSLELAAMTSKNAENSQESARLMEAVDRKVEQANITLDQMVVSMREITGSSNKISKVIKVIDEIAFQTNILALNAAVEAARAGEAGLGFAVVAEEVRNLAQRSAQAARDTAILIEESIAKSNEGGAKLNYVTEATRSITEGANAVKILVQEVNLGSQEQARGTDQISRAITQMEQVTQQTASSSEESAAAGAELSAQAETIRELALQLRTMVDGPSAPRGNVSNPARRTAAPRPAAPRRKSIVMPPRVKTDKSAFPLEEAFKEF
jgi:methyl-accepting chemotaxis protein